jgi:Na+-transporting NADH:ubiquinone oxidoreductase subunit C
LLAVAEITAGAIKRDINSVPYTVAFAAVVCVVCAALIATAAVLTKPSQVANALLYKEKNVLLVAGLIEPGSKVSTAQVEAIFKESIQARLVNLDTGDLAPEAGTDARRYDQRLARDDPATSRVAPVNPAGVRRVPNQGIAYIVRKGGTVDQIVIAIEGLGMWGTMYGFMALAPDGNTIRGLTFYDQRETPGLGGEIANPSWQALWRGRKAFDADWNVAIQVIKGQAGPPDTAPSQVDGLSGSTITSKAVTQLLRFWLGDPGYGRFLKKFREGAPA